MTLTPELVALSIRSEPELPLEPGWTIMSDDELGALATRYDRECGAAPLWVFAYGSLIWKPGFSANHSSGWTPPLFSMMKKVGMRRPEVEPGEPKVKVMSLIAAGKSAAGERPASLLAMK